MSRWDPADFESLAPAEVKQIEARRDARVEASWIVVKPVVKPVVAAPVRDIARAPADYTPPVGAPTAMGQVFDVAEQRRIRAAQAAAAAQREESERRLREKRERDAAIAAATREYQETVTPLEERVREIYVERVREPTYVRPEDPYAAAEKELADIGLTPEEMRQPYAVMPGAPPPVVAPVAVEPLAPGLEPRADSGIRKLLFLAVVASIVKALAGK